MKKILPVFLLIASFRVFFIDWPLPVKILNLLIFSFLLWEVVAKRNEFSYGTKEPKVKNKVLLSLCVVSTAVIFNYLFVVLRFGLKDFNFLWVNNSQPDALSVYIRQYPYVYYFLGIIVVPIFEEFIYRKILLSLFLKMNIPMSQFVTAILFVATHKTHIGGLIVIFFFALQANFIYKVTKNLKYTICFHCLNNVGIFFIWKYLGSMMLGNNIVLICISALFLVSVAGLNFLLAGVKTKKDPKQKVISFKFWWVYGLVILLMVFNLTTD